MAGSTSVPFRDLVSSAIGGGWGGEEPQPNSHAVRIIRGTDFKAARDGTLSSIPTRYEDSKKVTRRQLRDGDIVLEVSGGSPARGQSTGRSLLITSSLLDALALPTIPASFCRLIRLHADRVLPRYAFYALQDMYLSGRAAQYEQQSTGISNFQFEYFLDSEQVLLPPLPEQRAIAHILGTLDDKIELNRQMSATLEAMARALFESWFVRFDPVRAKAEGRDTGLPADIATLFPDSFEQSEIGEVPKGWSPRQVEDVATLVKSTLTPEHFPNEVFAHFSIPAYDGDGRPSLERGDSIKSNKFCVPRHAVLLSKLNPFTPRVWLTDTSPDIRAIASTEFLVLTPKAPALRSWLYCGVTESEFVATLAQKAGGTSNSHQRVKPDDVMKSCIRPHGGDVIESLFARQVDPLLERISTHSREQSLLSATRDTLLPKLISGDLRVPDAERFLADAGV